MKAGTICCYCISKHMIKDALQNSVHTSIRLDYLRVKQACFQQKYYNSPKYIYLPVLGPHLSSPLMDVNLGGYMFSKCDRSFHALDNYCSGKFERNFFISFNISVEKYPMCLKGWKKPKKQCVCNKSQPGTKVTLDEEKSPFPLLSVHAKLLHSQKLCSDVYMYLQSQIGKLTPQLQHPLRTSVQIHGYIAT